MKKTILITGDLDSSGLDLLYAQDDLEVIYKPNQPILGLGNYLEQAVASVSRSETDITKEVIDAAKNLRIIARAAVGVGNIAIDYATEKGILVFNAPGINTNSAAELTIAHLLATMRNVIPAHNHVDSGQWSRKPFMGYELRGKTIGLIGLGNVGRRVAELCNAFDMNILAYDPYIAKNQFSQANVSQCFELQDLLEKSDVVSLHVPLTNETRAMINTERINQMKDGVVLLNLARGPIIDDAAVSKALQNKKIRAVGLDTFTVEPPVNNLFRDHNNVCLTPHIGASTVESQRQIAIYTAQQLIKALDDGLVSSPINMPRVDTITSERSQHYVVLAEKIGSFTQQFIEFNPDRLEIMYRGELHKEEGTLIRLAFIKGFLQNTVEETITYVNSEKALAQRGIAVHEIIDPTFNVYPSAIMFTLANSQDKFTVGGIVFGHDNHRLTRINDFLFEIIPAGNMLVVSNEDRPGVIGDVGAALADNGVNINQFQLSRNMPGGMAMALITVDNEITAKILDRLKNIDNVVAVRLINI